MTPAQPPLEAPVEVKIDWANDCFDREGCRFHEDRRLADLLETLNRAICRSRENMLRTGIAVFAGNVKKKKEAPAAEPAWKNTTAACSFSSTACLVPPSRYIEKRRQAAFSSLPPDARFWRVMCSASTTSATRSLPGSNRFSSRPCARQRARRSFSFFR